jgi:hypothetical protein
MAWFKAGNSSAAILPIHPLKTDPVTHHHLLTAMGKPGPSGAK